MAAAAVWAGIPGGRDAFAETSEDLSGDLSGGGMAFLRLAVRGERRARRGSSLLRSGGRDQLGQLSRNLLHLGARSRPGRGALLADDDCGRARSCRASSATGSRYLQ